MKALNRWSPVVATMFLCGCFQVQDDLTLEPDGAGKVKLTLQSNLPEELISTMAMGGFSGRGASMYPPASEAEARHFFPAKDFVLKIDQKSAEDRKTLTIEAAFTNVNALLASPYGRAHQLTLKTNADGSLKLLTLSGGVGLAQLAQVKAEGEMAQFMPPGMEDAEKKKGEMRFEFRVTLPAAITEANGSREGKTVSWKVERAQCKDDDEFAAKLSGVLEASCTASGLKFSPATPPRLGLVAFNQLTAGKCGNTVALPDTNKIVSAARFVPYALQVTRSLDLSGEGSGQGSSAQLTGAILIPSELAPQRWGPAKLEEAVDGAGNSLMPKEDAESMMSRFTHRWSSYEGPADVEELDEDAPAKVPEPKPHHVSLSFKSPEWKVKKIAKVRGLQELQYLGASEIIKLTNAVPASLVMDMSKGRTSYSFENDRGQITDARLSALGLTVRVQMAMIQSGMTTVSLETSGGKSALVDAQVFDAEGKPWPTTLMQNESGAPGGEERSCQLMVAGKPKPPFSLALEVGGVGASVDIPILVENVVVGDK